MFAHVFQRSAHRKCTGTYVKIWAKNRMTDGPIVPFCQFLVPPQLECAICSVLGPLVDLLHNSCLCICIKYYDKGFIKFNQWSICVGSKNLNIIFIKKPSIIDSHFWQDRKVAAVSKVELKSCLVEHSGHKQLDAFKGENFFSVCILNHSAAEECIQLKNSIDGMLQL